jgi:apolipoprotein N-acyltransferase
MQTLGHSGERTGNAPALTLLERAAFAEKLPLTLICGLLLGFSSAGYGVWWLAWVGVAPLILLIFGARSRAEALLTGLLFGLTYHLVALRWLFDLHPLTWLGLPAWVSLLVALQAWLLESLHQALLFAIFAIFVFTLPMRAGFLPHYQRPFFPVLFSVPLIWVFLQWIVAPSPYFLGVPIDQLAYSQTRVPAVIQMARFGGAQLVDFVLLLVNTVLASFVMETAGIARKAEARADLMSERTGAIADLTLVSAVVALLLQWGHEQVRLDAAMPRYLELPPPLVDASSRKQPRAPIQLTPQQKADFAPLVPLVVAQGAIPIESLPKLSGAANAARYLPLIENQGAALVILPADVLDTARGTQDPLRLQLRSMALEQKKDIVVGFREKSSSGIWDGVRLYSADKFNRDSEYAKYRLVPLAEYTPVSFLSGLLPESLRRSLSGGDSHVIAPILTTLKSVWGRIGATIAAEIVYPDLIVSEVNRGASLLVNLSDLSCFHNSMLGQELLAAGCLRAVENGRYLVVASNTGVSAVVDPTGIVTSCSIVGRQGVLVDRVQFLHRKTPFARMCLWTPLYH